MTSRMKRGMALDEKRYLVYGWNREAALERPCSLSLESRTAVVCFAPVPPVCKSNCSPYLSHIRTKEAIRIEEKKSPIFSWLIKVKEDKMKGSAPGIPVQTEGPLKAALLCVWKLGATFFRSPKRRKESRLEWWRMFSCLLIARQETFYIYTLQKHENNYKSDILPSERNLTSNQLAV